MERLGVVTCLTAAALAAGCFSTPAFNGRGAGDAGSGSGSDAAGDDAAGDDAAGHEDAPHCGPWSSASQAPFTGSGAGDIEAAQSPTGTILTFTVRHANGTYNDIYYVSVTGTGSMATYSSALPVPNLSSNDDETLSGWSATGDKLYFFNSQDAAVRAVTYDGTTWSTPMPAGGLPANLKRARLSRDGLEAVYGDGGSVYSARRATATSTTWASNAISVVNTTSYTESFATLGLGDTELFFASDRNAGAYDIYRATRPSPDSDAWVLDSAVAIGGANHPDLSPDGTRIFFTKNDSQLFYADRSCP